MSDYPSQIADLLENVADRVRSMSVDRVAGWAKWTGVGIVSLLLGFVLLIFLMVGLMRLLAGVVGMQWAYTIIGGLFVAIGAFLWTKRLPREASQD
jgi:predicted lipid-binding transport protein (Tim44 family)